MENTLPRTKAQDEKFCSECGKIIKLKAEICPECGVRQHGLTPDSEAISDKKLSTKFWVSGVASFIMLVAITLASQPNEMWINGIVGSVIFALFTGLIAMALPTHKKIIYLPISLLITFIILYIIGTYQGLDTMQQPQDIKIQI